MVAQALDINKDYGNSMVPLLIGEQGYLKTQFCNHILPESLRDYYMKDIKMDKSIKKLRWRRNKNNGIKGYYLRLRKS